MRCLREVGSAALADPNPSIRARPPRPDRFPQGHVRHDDRCTATPPIVALLDESAAWAIRFSGSAQRSRPTSDGGGGMRVVMHPAVLTVILVGLLMRAWDIVATVTAFDWLAWSLGGVVVVLLVARHDP